MTEPWPEDILSRYLTAGGAVIDLTDKRDGTVLATCPGCTAQQAWMVNRVVDAEFWAQEHAARCRAIPRPASSTEGG